VVCSLEYPLLQKISKIDNTYSPIEAAYSGSRAMGDLPALTRLDYVAALDKYRLDPRRARKQRSLHRGASRSRGLSPDRYSLSFDRYYRFALSCGSGDIHSGRSGKLDSRSGARGRISSRVDREGEEDDDPAAGVKPGTPFEELPDDWVCPNCGVGKDMFDPVE